MRGNRLTLIIGGVFGFGAYWLGRHFFASIIYEATLLRELPNDLTILFFGFIAIAAGTIGAVGAVYLAASIAWKYYLERRMGWRLLTYNRSGGLQGVKTFTDNLIISMFACGAFSLLLSGKQLATIVATASLPSILQFIDSLPRNRTKVPDD